MQETPQGLWLLPRSLTEESSHFLPPGDKPVASLLGAGWRAEVEAALLFDVWTSPLSPLFQCGLVPLAALVCPCFAVSLARPDGLPSREGACGLVHRIAGGPRPPTLIQPSAPLPVTALPSPPGSKEPGATTFGGFLQ